jgi:hypothetical protein
MVLALEPLVRAKEAVGRQKDLLAATELRAIAARMTGQKGSPRGDDD